jgi:Mg-chelatase subunit ChlD
VSSGNAQARPQLDIEIAIDTTSSMGASIAQAQADSKRLVTEVQQRYPGALFAVVQFRDTGDDPEYQLLHPMTSDAAQVSAAIDTLSPAGGNDYPEAYNLVFQNSTTDPNTGWRTSSWS